MNCNTKKLINVIKYCESINITKSILFNVYDDLRYEDIDKFDKKEDICYELKNIIENLEYITSDMKSFINNIN